MQPHTGTLLIARDIGAGWGRQQAEELAQSLQARFNHPVVLCIPDDTGNSVADGLESLLNAGHRRICLLPLGLLPIPDRGPISLLLARAKRQWSDVSFHVAEPLTWLEWSRWLAQTALGTASNKAISSTDAGVLLIGNASSSPMSNADLARLAQLLRDSGFFAFVCHAFIGAIEPGISDAIHSISHRGSGSVLVVPWTLTAEEALRCFENDVAAAQSDNLNLILSNPSLAHPALINLLISNHYAAQAEPLNVFPSVPHGSDRSIGKSTRSELTPEEDFELRELEQRINTMLPSEYKGRFESVSPNSMGTAGLKFDSDGKVAWGEIWTSFCDLALAGGPPHRGTLLEAVTAAEALAEREPYDAVVAEIERGIRLVTTLPVITSQVPGWVGVRCDSEEMAIWLMRAIIVENIMVRRESNVLYLPAGPRFTLKREIKNVITSIAKTTHYWRAHLKARRDDE